MFFLIYVDLCVSQLSLFCIYVDLCVFQLSLFCIYVCFTSRVFDFMFGGYVVLGRVVEAI